MEIQRAHDVLAAIALREVPFLIHGEQAELGLTAALSVLCWALEHDHNTSFAEFLHRIEHGLEAAGYVLQRKNN